MAEERGEYLSGKVLLPMSPRGKGICCDVEERVDVSKVLPSVGRAQNGFSFFPEIYISNGTY